MEHLSPMVHYDEQRVSVGGRCQYTRPLETKRCHPDPANGGRRISVLQ